MVVRITTPERGLQLRKKANHEIIRQYRCTVLIYFDWVRGCDRKCVTHSLTHRLTDWVRNGSKYLRCFRNEKKRVKSVFLEKQFFFADHNIRGAEGEGKRGEGKAKIIYIVSTFSSTCWSNDLFDSQ